MNDSVGIQLQYFLCRILRGRFSPFSNLIKTQASKDTYFFFRERMEYKNFIKQHILNFSSFILTFINDLLECNSWILCYLYYCGLRTKVSFPIPSLPKLQRKCNTANTQKSPSASRIYQGSFSSSHVSGPVLYLPTIASLLLLNKAKLFPTSGLYMSAQNVFPFISFPG